ncbi:MAG TPA: MBL fold metallo-hydrolase [Anaerolineales bacterium]|nr:MBL fold metallo-hydrolase [Anaerolineales bacterium]
MMGHRMDQLEPTIQTYETACGGRIHQIPLEAFPGFWTSVYVVLVEDLRVLIDSGSGYGNSNDQLEAGLSRVSRLESGKAIGLSDLTHIFITHGHIDHFGGLSYIRPRTQALLGIHELDRRNLTNYEERLVVVGRQMERFLVEAGVSPDRLGSLLDLYLITKGLFHSVRVDITYEAIGMHLGPFEFLHVPGHCAGQVVIRLHDVLFSGDHVLEDITPHQAPESLTLSTGLEHYLRSLDSLEPWANQARLTLTGHKLPIKDLPARLEAIRAAHAERLNLVLDMLAEPHTIAEISHALFGEVHGYTVLLALEEAGAHVEYLYQRGRIGIENLAELEAGDGPVAIKYYRL